MRSSGQSPPVLPDRAAPPPPHASLPRAAARLALWALAVSMIISRLGLVLHELVGHGLAAMIAGGRVTEVHLYAFGGGWIEYGGHDHWTPAVVTGVSLAGIAVEVVAGLALAGIARRRGRDDVAGTGLLAAALGLALHAGFYLAAGTADGFGDGAVLHHALGGARAVLVVPLGLGLAALAYLGGRRVGGELRATLPDSSRGRHALAVAAALAAAGAIHGGLVAGELAVRPSPIYQRVMATARDRAVEDELAQWQAAAARAGRAPTPDEVAGTRRTIGARHRGVRLGPPLAIALVLAAGLGLVTARRPRRRPLVATATRTTVAIAVAAVILVVAIDVAATARW